MSAEELSEMGPIDYLIVEEEFAAQKAKLLG
jgi:hypothetical protein